MMDEADAALIVTAQAARANAHAPYSRFAVGAALRLTDGSIITGANFENASLGLSLCAETVALASANSAGRLHEVTAIAVAGGPIDAPCAEALSPCGRCRQLLAEAEQLAGRSIRVYCADGSGEARVYTVAELLPHAFSASAFAADPNK
jgi:cytidine deaminase